jgi:hypothetical protein
MDAETAERHVNVTDYMVLSSSFLDFYTILSLHGNVDLGF